MADHSSYRDYRKPAEPLVRYVECHNDDVSEVIAFHQLTLPVDVTDTACSWSFNPMYRLVYYQAAQMD